MDCIPCIHFSFSLLSGAWMIYFLRTTPGEAYVVTTKQLLKKNRLLLKAILFSLLTLVYHQK